MEKRAECRREGDERGEGNRTETGRGWRRGQSAGEREMRGGGE